MKSSRLILMLAVTWLLAAFSGGDFADIEAWITEVDARPKGTIEPLPRLNRFNRLLTQQAPKGNLLSRPCWYVRSSARTASR